LERAERGAWLPLGTKKGRACRASPSTKARDPARGWSLDQIPQPRKGFGPSSTGNWGIPGPGTTASRWAVRARLRKTRPAPSLISQLPRRGMVICAAQQAEREEAVPKYLCKACGTQHPERARPPERCPICEDERQFVPPAGQEWIVAEALAAGRFNVFRKIAPGLFGISTVPQFAIGQRAFLVATPGGNILWDCLSLLDSATIESMLLNLSEGVGRRLRGQHLRGRTITLQLRVAPFETRTRQRTLAEPTDDDLKIFGTARQLLRDALAEDRQNGRTSPVRLVGVSASGIETGRQLGLFDHARTTRLNAALDSVREKFGDKALDRASARLRERRRFSDRRTKKST